MQNTIICAKLISQVLRRQAVLRSGKSFPAINSPINSREESKTFAHQFGNLCFHFINVGDDFFESSLIKVKSVGELFEDANIIDDQAVGLRVPVDTVCSANCLQKGMILHRLVQIHCLQNRRIESSKQLGSNDDQLQGVLRVSEAIQNLRFLICGTTIFLVTIFLIVICIHNDLGALCRSEKAIQSFLIQDAALAIIADNLSLKPIRLNLGHVVIIDMLANLLNSGGCFDNGGHLDTARKVSAFLLGQAFRKLGKCFVNCILIDMKINRDCFKIQWKRSTIADGVRE